MVASRARDKNNSGSNEGRSKNPAPGQNGVETAAENPQWDRLALSLAQGWFSTGGTSNKPGPSAGVTLRASHPTIQRQPAGESTSMADAGATVASLIAEDDAVDLLPGQMRKDEFLAATQSAVCAEIEPILAAAGRTAENCSYLEAVFRVLRRRTPAYIGGVVSRFAPELSGANSAVDFIPLIAARARQSALEWQATGEIAGLPEGVPSAAEIATGALGGLFGLQFKQEAGTSPSAPDPVSVRSQLKNGQSLDSGVAARMGAAFGADFSGVRVHTGPDAVQLSRHLRARAFTVGEDIAFAPGQYRPRSISGNALLAHELAHVLQQQGAASTSRREPGEGAGYDSLEADANRAAAGVLARLWWDGRNTTGSSSAHASGVDATQTGPGLATDALLAQWDLTEDDLSNVAQTAIPSLRSGLQLSRCNGDETAEEHTPPEPAPEPKPKPKPPPPPKPLFEQLQTGQERQDAIDKVVKEMGGRIDTSLMEDGKMFYNGMLPGEGLTSPPKDKELAARRKKKNKKPYVEIGGGAFADGWPLLETTVWHEYQHVKQMARSPDMLVPGKGKGHAQEVEAYCLEIIEAEERKLHLQEKAVVQVKGGGTEEQTGKEYIEKTLWRRLTGHWVQVDKAMKKKLQPLHSKAKEAAERMVGHSL